MPYLVPKSCQCATYHLRELLLRCKSPIYTSADGIWLLRKGLHHFARMVRSLSLPLTKVNSPPYLECGIIYWKHESRYFFLLIFFHYFLAVDINRHSHGSAEKPLQQNFCLLIRRLSWPSWFLSSVICLSWRLIKMENFVCRLVQELLLNSVYASFDWRKPLRITWTCILLGACCTSPSEFLAFSCFVISAITSKGTDGWKGMGKASRAGCGWMLGCWRMRAMRERASERGGREAVREPVSIQDACVKVARPLPDCRRW